MFEKCDVNKPDAHGPTGQATLLTIGSDSVLGEVKTENVDSSANKPVHTVVVKANSTPAFSFRLAISFLCEHANFDFTSSTFSPSEYQTGRNGEASSSYDKILQLNG